MKLSQEKFNWLVCLGWFGELLLRAKIHVGFLLLPVSSFSVRCLFWTVHAAALSHSPKLPCFVHQASE